MMMPAIRQDLAALNVKHDVFFSERSLIEGESDRVAQTIIALRERGGLSRPIAAARKALPSRTGRIASRHFFARPISATMSTGR